MALCNVVHNMYVIYIHTHIDHNMHIVYDICVAFVLLLLELLHLYDAARVF